MIKTTRILLVILLVVAVSLAIISCERRGGDSKKNRSEAEMTASAGYLARKALYLQYCNDNSGPGSGRFDGQVCRAFTGVGTFDEAVITNALDNKVDIYKDTSDFDMAKIIRILWIDHLNPSLPDALRARMKTSVLSFT